jgi:hypothetical protein
MQRLRGPYEEKPTGPELPNQRKFEEIASHRGQRHMLLIFTPSPAKTPYKHFMHEIDDNLEDFELRNLEMLLIFDTGRAPRAWNYLPGQQAVKARHKFGVGTNEFAIVLLGLDGHIRKRWNDSIDYEELAKEL